MPPKRTTRKKGVPPGHIRAGGVKVGRRQPLALIAGPCVIESSRAALSLAADLAKMARRIRAPLIFKASYDKANRTSIDSFRGPGLEKGLAVLARVREETGLPVLTDVHSPDEARRAAEVVDVLQIPAFLCRQTDLLVAAAETGRPVNIKKGQFMAPADMKWALAKAASAGKGGVMLTERGTSFGYNRLVVDFSGLPLLAALGAPVIFDATHSVQMPGAAGGSSGGSRESVPVLARAAAAAGSDAFFFEVHPNPPRAKSDSANSITPTVLAKLWPILVELDRITKRGRR